MSKRTLGKIVRIIGVIILIVLVIIIAGPFLIPVNSPEGLSTASEVATAESKFTTIPYSGTDGIDIHYIDSPSQSASTETTFLLLHGSLFNSYTWNQIIDELSQYGRVVAYDQMPYGLSEKLVEGEWTGDNPYSPEAAIEQLTTFMDASEIDSAILVGHSYGGSLAAQAALANPDRVDALIFISPAVYVEEEMPGWLMNLPQVKHLGPLLARQLTTNDGFLRQMYLNPDPIVADRLPLTRIQTNVSNWDVAFWEYLRAWQVDVDNLAANIPSLVQPSIVLAGDSDAIVPLTDSQRLADDLPDAEFELLQSCGHVPQEECPELLTSALELWLDDLLKQ